MHQQGSIMCPQCGRAECVQKVSAVVASGTTTGIASGWMVGRAGHHHLHGTTIQWSHQQTRLATLLAPPRQPRPTAEAAAVVALVMLSGWFLCVFSQAALVVEEANWVFFVVWAVFVALPVFLFVLLVRSMGRQTVERHRAWQEWRRQMQQWQVLYYCHRCDGVFVPGLPLFAPASATQTFLAQP